MNFTVLHVQIVIVECPCAKACQRRSPLDDLADQLRREMQFGRDCDRAPAGSFDRTIDAAPCRHFQLT